MTLAIDLDGTLVDCRRRQVTLAGILHLAHTGTRLPERDFWREKRNGRSTFDALISIGLGRALAKLVADEWVAGVESPSNLKLDALLPGATCALHLVRRAGISVVLLTARGHRGALDAELQRLGLMPLLSEVLVVAPESPASAKAEALRRLRASAYIGDTEADHVAATMAGVPFLAVSHGQRSPDFLRRAGVEEIVGHVLEATQAVLPRIAGAADRQEKHNG